MQSLLYSFTNLNKPFITAFIRQIYPNTRFNILFSTPNTP